MQEVFLTTEIMENYRHPLSIAVQDQGENFSNLQPKQAGPSVVGITLFQK